MRASVNRVIPSWGWLRLPCAMAISLRYQAFLGKELALVRASVNRVIPSWDWLSSPIASATAFKAETLDCELSIWLSIIVSACFKSPSLAIAIATSAAALSLSICLLTLFNSHRVC